MLFRPVVIEFQRSTLSAAPSLVVSVFVAVDISASPSMPATVAGPISDAWTGIGVAKVKVSWTNRANIIASGPILYDEIFGFMVLPPTFFVAVIQMRFRAHSQKRFFAILLYWQPATDAVIVPLCASQGSSALQENRHYHWKQPLLSKGTPVGFSGSTWPPTHPIEIAVIVRADANSDQPVAYMRAATCVSGRGFTHLNPPDSNNMRIHPPGTKESRG